MAKQSESKFIGCNVSIEKYEQLKQLNRDNYRKMTDTIRVALDEHIEKFLKTKLDPQPAQDNI